MVKRQPLAATAPTSTDHPDLEVATISPSPSQTLRRQVGWRRTSFEEESGLINDIQERVFVQPGGYPVTESSLNRILRPYFKKLGVTGNAHLIRHTVATHLIQAGMPLRYVQELLGHESLQSTLVYVHLVIKDLQREYRKTHPRELKILR